MALANPQTTDFLNSPSHAKGHQVYDWDTAAPSDSVVVDSGGNVGIGQTVSGNILSINRTDEIISQTNFLNFAMSDTPEFTIKTNAVLIGSWSKGSAFDPTMTSATTPSPNVVTWLTNYANQEGWEVFDGSIADVDSWVTPIQGNDWIKLDLGAGNTKRMYSYGIQISTSGGTRSPKTWTMQGSNDDSTWDTLDTVTNESGFANGESREYVCDTIETAYRYFKINVTVVNPLNDGYLGIGEMYFYEATSDLTIPDLTLGAGGNHLTIKSSGYVGIGTTEPVTELDVAGSMQVSSAVALSLGGYICKYSEATATLSGANTIIQVNIPSGSRILGCQLRVDTLITSGDGGTSWAATYTGGASQAIGTTEQVFTKNTKVSAMFNDTTETDIVGSEVDVLIDCDGAYTFNAGVVRAIVYYETFTAMGTAA